MERTECRIKKKEWVSTMTRITTDELTTRKEERAYRRWRRQIHWRRRIRNSGKSKLYPILWSPYLILLWIASVVRFFFLLLFVIARFVMNWCGAVLWVEGIVVRIRFAVICVCDVILNCASICRIHMVRYSVSLIWRIWNNKVAKMNA